MFFQNRNGLAVQERLQARDAIGDHLLQFRSFDSAFHI